MNAVSKAGPNLTTKSVRSSNDCLHPRNTRLKNDNRDTAGVRAAGMKIKPRMHADEHGFDPRSFAFIRGLIEDAIVSVANAAHLLCHRFLHLSYGCETGSRRYILCRHVIRIGQTRRAVCN